MSFEEFRASVRYQLEQKDNELLQIKRDLHYLMYHLKPQIEEKKSRESDSKVFS